MFASGLILKNAAEKYRSSKRREQYSAVAAAKAGASSALALFWLIFAILFFFMELIVLYYAISISFSCTQKGPERVVNIVLAVLFPFPYVMLNILFNKCAKSRLQNGSFSEMPTLTTL